jgi:hypothetical protein
VSATELTKTCALEELSRWVIRRKGELDPKAAPSGSTPARNDDERTEPDKEIGRHVWEPLGAPHSQVNPTLVVHPSIMGGLLVTSRSRPIHNPPILRQSTHRQRHPRFFILLYNATQCRSRNLIHFTPHSSIQPLTMDHPCIHLCHLTPHFTSCSSRVP